MENYLSGDLGRSSEDGLYPLRPHAPGFGQNVLLPVLGTVGFFLIHHFFIPGVFALTTLLLILLAFLAFRLRPKVLVRWAFLYALAIFALSFLPMGRAGDPVTRPFVRTAVFLTGGIAVVLLAVNRRRLEMGHETLFRILSGLPLPVIVSDVSGSILLLSEQARLILKHDVNQLAGLSFFSTFIDPVEQGRAIATYISYFDSTESTTFETALRTRGEPALSLTGKITIVTTGKHRFAVTVMEPVEPAKTTR